ncbi:hypothetical protein [Seonamhaeicola sp.]|uniref:hypothetical protein n=1 Tax=Seonamhaeicola sp. TaxID=1912245 RepID=UPI0026265802|nr:hypothetical protein [Seonamhaeicola sp.]
MKTFTSAIIILYLSSFTVFAQRKTISIDVSGNIYKKSTVITPGTYKIQIKNIDPNKIYEAVINSEFHKLDPLSIPKKTEELQEQITEDSLSSKIIDTIKLSKNQDLTIKVVVLKNVKKEENLAKEKEYIYTYKTEKKGSWQTTFGFNFINLKDRDTYFSKALDSTYIITRGTNQNKIDFHPSVMFTWFPNNSETFNVGLSGGLGYDLEKSLSVFTGISLIYNQNITITTGCAFHNQKLLNSKYKKGDVINESLSFEQLHKDYIRFNPFVSISFRLDKSPF